jgi:hypothetical protein
MSKHITAEEAKNLIALLKEGLSGEEIAVKTGHAVRTVGIFYEYITRVGHFKGVVLEGELPPYHKIPPGKKKNGYGEVMNAVIFLLEDVGPMTSKMILFMLGELGIITNRSAVARNLTRLVWQDKLIKRGDKYYVADSEKLTE